MEMVPERPQWRSNATTEAWPVDAPVAVVTAQVRPMGPHSRFTARSMASACLNCGEWIHPGTHAWYDPELDESVCTGCWPEWVTATASH